MCKNYNVLSKCTNTILNNRKAANDRMLAIESKSATSKWLFSFLVVSCMFFSVVSSNAQTNSIFESYAILSLNGGSNAYYDMNAVTANPDFQGNNLGSFAIGLNSLVVKGGQNKTNKCNGGDIFNGHLYWRYWRTSNGASGIFNTELMSFISNDGGLCGGDQTWESTTGSTNIISGILPGNYSLEVYSDADGVPGTVYSSNSGANYIANFTVPAPDNVLLYSGTNVAGGTYYNTLKLAFDAINAGSYTGNLHILVYGNTTETASAVLNASGVGLASYTALDIKPDNGASRTISGAIAGHLIDLNGASNVIINGLNTGGNSLTISNTSTGTGSSTIRFTADASSNTVTNATVLGSTGSALSSGFGVIYFATGTVTGNDNNTISNCTIGSAGTNLPINGIYSFGTSAAIDNSGISITNNRIFDYFNTNSASNGMNINTGNSSWTIDGNSFYQTATRTYTTANTHNGIVITSGSGYTIINNKIGGSAANAGGTPYAMAGTIATRFVAINVAAGTTAAVNSIQGNTVANITLNTSSGATTTNGIICGINVTAGNANIGTVTGNTIGATTGVDNIKAVSTTAGGLVVGINYSATGTAAIQNNTIGSLTSSGITASISGSIAGINISGAVASSTISNNTIGNSTANNMRGGTLGLTTGSSIVTGILFNAAPATTATVNVSSNSIQNLSSFGTGGTGSVRGIQTPGVTSTAAVINITSNTITNLTTNNTNPTFANGTNSANGIAYSGGTSNGSVSLNTISNISNTNTASTASCVAGIAHGNSTNTSIFRNKIYNLTNAGTSTTSTTPSQVSGIIVRSGATAINIFNNMISLGNGQSTNTVFVGIQGNNGSTPDPIENIYFNSINIEGTVASGAQPSIGIYRGDFSVTARTVTVNIKNNIITNSRSGSTGKHYAIANNLGATASATGWAANTCNNNVLNANAATVGFWTSDQTFASWKTISAGDGLSVSGVSVPFVNAAAGDLHVNFGVTPNTLESGAVAIAGITTDYDNQNRPGPAGSVNGGGTAPDIGADEFDGVYLDLVAPAISYSPLGFTCATGIRTLVATITDASGVPTTGLGLPVLYWRINAGAYNAVTATSLGSGQYQFVFGSGTTTGDVVSYYIVAQDTSATPNVGSSPSIGAAGFTANPPAAATPPSSTNSYSINSSLAPGTYTVGATGNYTTLTAAINDYNTRCLSGPIVFTLLDATYAEAGGMTIAKNPDASAINTLTIKPATGVNASVTATAANTAVLKILGNYVTIDGSNNGSTTRNLTITNLSATAPNVVVIGSTGTSPITNVTLKNAIAINGISTSSAIVTSDGALIGTAGYFSSISILNNDIQKAFIGTFSIAAAGNATGLTVSDNTLNTSGANAIRRVGIYVQGVNGVTVSGNTIGNIETATAENDNGIWLASDTRNATVSNNTISNLGCATTANAPTAIYITPGTSGANNITVTGNTISTLTSAGGAVGTSTNGIFAGFATGDVTISKNTISNIKNTSTTGWGANGILLSSTLTAANYNVNNNFINDVSGFGFAGFTADDNGYGIAVTSGAGYNIYYNTVNLFTNQTTAGGVSAAFLATVGVSTAGAINLRNNIFANNQTGGSTERYSIYSGAPNTIFSAIDYNDYYSAGANLGFIGSNRADLTAIQAGFGGNANSKNVAPVFVAPASNLHLIPASNAALDNFGTPIAGITSDFDGDTRNATAPDMGADEFANSSIVNLKLFIQGYFDGGSMRSVKFLQDGISPTTDVENVTVELRSTSSPYGVVASTTALLKTDGTAIATFASAPSGSFYIAVNNSNAIKTWSKLPQTVGGTTLYDFTIAATQAYSDSMKDLGAGVFGFYSGDINQDGSIDGTDAPNLFDDVDNSAFGVQVTDLNGDGSVDNSDVPFYSDNSDASIYSHDPNNP